VAGQPPTGSESDDRVEAQHNVRLAGVIVLAFQAVYIAGDFYAVPSQLPFFLPFYGVNIVTLLFAIFASPTDWFGRHWRIASLSMVTALDVTGALMNIHAGTDFPHFLTLIPFSLGCAMFLPWGPAWQAAMNSVLLLSYAVVSAIEPPDGRDRVYRWIALLAVLVLSQAAALLADRYRRRLFGNLLALREGEAELRRSEALTRNIVDTAFEAIITTDARGEILTWNPRAEAIFGWTSSEAQGKPIISLLVPESEREWVEPIAGEIGAGGHLSLLGNALTTKLVDRSGREFPAEIVISQLRLKNGAGFSVFARDISERRRVERELVEARETALQASRAKSEFLAAMSHEIRTPLNAIVGMTELLQSADLTPEQRRRTKVIVSSGELLLTIVNDILDFSKLSEGKVVLERIDFDPVELIENTVDSFAQAASVKRLDLVLHLDFNMPRGLRGDPSRLRQVLNNLIANAIKFTSAGEVMVRVARIEDNPVNVVVRFDVSDTGIGIARKAQLRLFQPFVQAEGSTSRRYGGSGLGLVISAQLVKQMGGEIRLDSELGKGSTFCFTARFDKGQAAAHSWATDGVASRFREMHAVIVDDNASTRQVISEYMSSWGITSEAFASGGAMLEQLKSAQVGGMKPACVVLDSQMPGIDGVSVACAIRANDSVKDTKIIMMCPEGGPGTEADRWIAKPVRPSQLFNCLLELFVSDGRTGVDPRPAAGSALTRDTAGQARKSGRILLIDDNPVNRGLVAEQLHVLGYAADMVENAPRALETLARERYDLVLMDCEMPGMDGYEATGEIRRREGGDRHSLIIALTAHATEGQRERCLAAGMDGYLSKPVRLKELANTLDIWLCRMAVDDAALQQKVTDGESGWKAEPELDPAVLAEIAALSASSGHNILRELVDLFLLNLPGRLASVRRALDSNDIRTLGAVAHSLKGSLANLGAKRFSALCARVEQSAVEGDRPQAVILANMLLDEARSIPELFLQCFS